MKSFLCSMLLCICFAGYTQDTNYIKKYLLGDKEITFYSSCFTPCSNNISFINVHDDENTSVDAAEAYLTDAGGMLMQLKHGGKREIVFNLQGKSFLLDPNRMFTKTGLLVNLKLTSAKHGAYIAAQAFASELLKQYVIGKKLVIALHNNTEGKLSIKSYQPNGTEARNTAMIYEHKAMDADDFILTTERMVFDALKKKQINVVLQKTKPVDDGSLSVYAARTKIPYINIEAQHGHESEQVRMLEVLQDVFKKYDKR